MDEEDEDLNDLLKELDEADDTGNQSNFQENVVDGSNSLAFCTVKQPTGYSAIDSVYESRTQLLLPMIDISTPQIFSQSIKLDIDLDSDLVSDLDEDLNLDLDGKKMKLLIAETFNLEDLKWNLRVIDESLHLNPIEAIKSSIERRISFPIALMLRDFRQIGSMGQLRLLDGSGNEIIGTIPFSSCLELKIKLHFGLIFVLTNVSTFSPVPNTKYLNITRGNIQSFHYNTGMI